MSVPLFKLEESTKNLILEVAALSGYSQSIVKECYEYMVLNWAVKLADHPGEVVSLDVPFLGTVNVKYDGDEVLPTGELSTKLLYNVTFLPSFKKLVGEIEDEGYTEIIPLITKKIENAVMVASAD